MDWNLISFVTSSKLRFKILELEEKNLIKCLTPERRKNKFYETTGFGKELLDFISKETKRRPTSLG